MTIYAAILGNGHVPGGDLLQPHLDFLAGLRARGIVLGNGRLFGGPGGLVLLRADSEQTARDILADDPFLVHGLRTLELFEWDVTWAAGLCLPPHDPVISAIAADALDARLAANEDAFVLDVREDAEVARGTAPRTVHIALGQLGDRIGELPAGEAFVICRGGGRSLKACRLLAAHGRAAVNVTGGMTAYSPEKA